MSNKEKLKSLAIDVNNLLSEYIELQDEIVDKSKSFLNIFKPIDFGDLFKRSNEILMKLREKNEEERTIRDSLTDDMEKQFISCLGNYTNALIEAVEALSKKIEYLLAGSKGKSVSFFQHMRNDKLYKKAVNKYLSFGEELNSLFDKL